MSRAKKKKLARLARDAANRLRALETRERKGKFVDFFATAAGPIRLLKPTAVFFEGRHFTFFRKP